MTAVVSHVTAVISHVTAVISHVTRRLKRYISFAIHVHVWHAH